MKIISLESIILKAQHFLIVQLFLTLISLPILVTWGLPLSILSPVGNLIFSPFLTLFLLLSSLIFFTQLVCIPNNYIIWILEHLTWLWHYLLQWSSPSVLYAFKKAPLLLLLIIPILTITLIHHPLLHSPRRKLIALIMVSTITWSILTWSPMQKSWSKNIECNNGFVSLVSCNNKTVLIDPGIIGKRISAPSWIAYTLIPEIIQATGSLTLDTVICNAIGKIQFDALALLVRKMIIKKIYLPSFQGELPPSCKKSFNRFYAIARSQDCKIIRLYNKPITIIDKELAIFITPKQKHLYQNIPYIKPNITAFIDNQQVPIYSPKE